jgi:signal transduction histidine kinase
MKKDSLTDNEVNYRIQILQKVSFLSETDPQILRLIAKALTETEVKKGHPVFMKGDLDKAMYIIVTGSVQVHDGDHVFTTLFAEEYFGEYSLIDTSERSASVTAIEDTVLLELDENLFYGFINEQNRLMKGVLRSLINRVRDKDALEEMLTRQNLEIHKQKEEIMRQRDELEEQRKKLQESNSTKDKFFSIIAHDLRSPFTITLGFTELLMKKFDTFTTEQIKEFIVHIHESSQKQFKLLENLLQWSRIQLGRIRFDPINVNLNSICNNVISVLELNAKKKDIDIINEIKDDTKIYADENMITTIGRNLLSNAIKFTPRGGKIKLYSTLKNNYVEIWVQDSGIGISADTLPKLFRIDENTSTPGTEEETGTGLGLVLCKELVEKHGGQIYAESIPGEGTTMKFTVPSEKFSTN